MIWGNKNGTDDWIITFFSRILRLTRVGVDEHKKHCQERYNTIMDLVTWGGDDVYPWDISKFEIDQFKLELKKNFSTLKR